jgi:hypothetical protein
VLVVEERIIHPVGHDLTVYDSTIFLFTLYITNKRVPVQKQKKARSEAIFLVGDFRMARDSFFLFCGGAGDG